jgi:MarR family 2-MHQ and catechol resistance regulon transcriptional repressor
MGTKHRGPERERVALDAYIKLTRSLNSVQSRVVKRNPFPKDLTESQFGVLEALYHLGPLNQKALGQKILRSKGDMSLVIENLGKAGLVTRRHDEGDRRSWTVELTKDGLVFIAGFFPKHARAVAEAMGALSVEEQKTLGRLCKKLGL